MNATVHPNLTVGRAHFLHHFLQRSFANLVGNRLIRARYESVEARTTASQRRQTHKIEQPRHDSLVAQRTVTCFRHAPGKATSDAFAIRLVPVTQPKSSDFVTSCHHLTFSHAQRTWNLLCCPTPRVTDEVFGFAHQPPHFSRSPSLLQPTATVATSSLIHQHFRLLACDRQTLTGDHRGSSIGIISTTNTWTVIPQSRRCSASLTGFYHCSQASYG